MKKIISKELIADIENSYNELAAKNLAECKEYQFNNVENFAIGLVTVVKYGNTSMLNLKTEANKEYMSSWRKDVGIILARDFRTNSAQGKYFEFVTKNTKTFLRRIADDELAKFEKEGFDFIRLGDYNYVVIIHTAPDTPYLLAAPHFENDVISTTEDPEDDYIYVEEPEAESLSLFE